MKKLIAWIICFGMFLSAAAGIFDDRYTAAHVVNNTKMHSDNGDAAVSVLTSTASPSDHADSDVSGTNTQALSIIRQPETKTVNLGDSVEISVEAQGNGLTYQWYYKEAAQTSWYAWSGHTQPAETLVPDRTWNRVRLFCRVNDSYGHSVDSDIVLITMNDSVVNVIANSPLSRPAGSGDTVYSSLCIVDVTHIAATKAVDKRTIVDSNIPVTGGENIYFSQICRSLDYPDSYTLVRLRIYQYNEEGTSIKTFNTTSASGSLHLEDSARTISVAINTVVPAHDTNLTDRFLFHTDIYTQSQSDENDISTQDGEPDRPISPVSDTDTENEDAILPSLPSSDYNVLTQGNTDYYEYYLKVLLGANQSRKAVDHGGFFTKDLYQNSPLAFLTAAKEGITFHNLDIVFSSDNVPFVIHNNIVTDIDGVKFKISENTAETIKKHKLGDSAYNWIPQTLAETNQFIKSINGVIEMVDVSAQPTLSNAMYLPEYYLANHIKPTYTNWDSETNRNAFLEKDSRFGVYMVCNTTESIPRSIAYIREHPGVKFALNIMAVSDRVTSAAESNMQILSDLNVDLYVYLYNHTLSTNAPNKIPGWADGALSERVNVNFMSWKEAIDKASQAEGQETTPSGDDPDDETTGADTIRLDSLADFRMGTFNAATGKLVFNSSNSAIALNALDFFSLGIKKITAPKGSHISILAYNPVTDPQTGQETLSYIGRVTDKKTYRTDGSKMTFTTLDVEEYLDDQHRYRIFVGACANLDTVRNGLTAQVEPTSINAMADFRMGTFNAATGKLIFNSSNSAIALNALDFFSLGIKKITAPKGSHISILVYNPVTDPQTGQETLSYIGRVTDKKTYRTDGSKMTFTTLDVEEYLDDQHKYRIFVGACPNLDTVRNGLTAQMEPTAYDSE